MTARLTTTPAQVPLSRLSRPLYDDFLATAKAAGFSFVPFKDLAAGRDRMPDRFIALRHDVDFAPAYSLEMARLEHEAGIVATYFVLVDGQFYDALDREVMAQLREIRSLGHEIGLHYDSRSAVEPDLGSEVAMRLDLLSRIVGGPVRSFSQHDPVNAGPARLTLPPGHDQHVDAAEAITRHDLLYVSDSAMLWRQHTFHSALAEGRNLCLLAHPHSWLHPADDYVAMIRDLQDREVSRLSGRYDRFVDALADYYDRRLRDGV